MTYSGITDEELKHFKPQGKCGATTEPCYWRRATLCYFSGACKDKQPLKSGEA